MIVPQFFIFVQKGTKKERKKVVVTVISLIFLVEFGVWYARRVYLKPFRVGWTWLGVTIGVEATLVGMMGLLFAAMHYWQGMETLPALLISFLAPHIAFALTGGPMIWYQIRKDAEHMEETLARLGG